MTYKEGMLLLSRKGGDRHDVAANGTCWLYAVMGALHVLEAMRMISVYVFGKATKISPSRKDVSLSEAFLDVMNREFQDFPEPPAKELSRREDFDKMARQMDIMRVWNFEMGEEMAPFGGDKQFFLLARALGRHIVCLHGPTMAPLWVNANRNQIGLNRMAKLHQLFGKESMSIEPRMVSIVGVLLHLEQFPDTLVVEWDGVNHYHALVRQSEVGIHPLFLEEALRKYAQ